MNVHEEAMSSGGWIHRLDLLSSRAVSRIEATVAGLLLTALGLVVYGPHVVRGDFTLDDWAFRADYDRFGYWGFVERVLELEPGALIPAGGGGRFVQAVYQATAFAGLGGDARPHLLLAILLGVLMSFLLFLVLRAVGFARLHAAAIAALALVFPAADSPRLWPAASQSELAISLYLVGLLLSLAAVERAGLGARVRRAGAVACYALAMLCYEVVFGGILLGVLVYRLRLTWRQSARYWLVDLGALALVSAYLRFVARGEDFLPLSTQLEKASTIVNQTRILVSRLGVPDGPALMPAEVLALVFVAVAVVELRLPRTDELRHELRRWLLTVLAGCVVVFASYLALLPIEGRLPLNPGFGNRGNIGAAAGYALLAYGFAMLLGTLLVRGVSALRPLSNARVSAAVLGAGVALVVGAWWSVATIDDRRAWERAAEIRHQTLEALESVPAAARRPTVYTFGVGGLTAPGVVTFAGSWDLTGAIRTLWGDDRVLGIPSPSVESGLWGNSSDDFGITCGRSRVRPEGRLYSERDAAPYGSVLFVDVPSRAHIVVAAPEECRTWAKRYGLLQR